MLRNLIFNTRYENNIDIARSNFSCRSYNYLSILLKLRKTFLKYIEFYIAQPFSDHS